MTPYVVKWSEKLRSMQPGVLEGVICSGTWLASHLPWLLRAVGLQADGRDAFLQYAKMPSEK